MQSPSAAALQNSPETASVLWVFPVLDRPSVDVWPESKFGVPRLAYSEPVKVGYRIGQVNEGGWVRSVPKGEKEALGCDGVGVRSGSNLGRGVVKLVDLNVVLGEACGQVKYDIVMPTVGRAYL